MTKCPFRSFPLLLCVSALAFLAPAGCSDLYSLFRSDQVVGMYEYREPGESQPAMFIELREDNTAIVGELGRGRWIVSHEYERVEIRFDDWDIGTLDYIDFDHSSIASDNFDTIYVGRMTFVRTAGAISHFKIDDTTIVWSEYVDSRGREFLRFNERNTIDEIALAKWDRDGDIVNIHDLPRHGDEEFRIEGNTLVLEDEDLVFVKADIDR